MGDTLYYPKGTGDGEPVYFALISDCDVLPFRELMPQVNTLRRNYPGSPLFWRTSQTLCVAPGQDPAGGIRLRIEATNDWDDLINTLSGTQQPRPPFTVYVLTRPHMRWMRRSVRSIVEADTWHIEEMCPGTTLFADDPWGLHLYGDISRYQAARERFRQHEAEALALQVIAVLDGARAVRRRRHRGTGTLERVMDNVGNPADYVDPFIYRMISHSSLPALAESAARYVARTGDTSLWKPLLTLACRGVSLSIRGNQVRCIHDNESFVTIDVHRTGLRTLAILHDAETSTSRVVTVPELKPSPELSQVYKLERQRILDHEIRV